MQYLKLPHAITHTAFSVNPIQYLFMYESIYSGVIVHELLFIFMENISISLQFYYMGARWDPNKTIDIED